MATELGQAYVQIMPSAKGISGAISKQFDPEASSAGESAGNSMGSKMISVIKGVVATAAIGKFFQSSLMEGADLQQSLGGIETLFKGSADKVKGYANEAYKTAGLSANKYMESVTSFSASLLQSMGGDTEKAGDKANMALIDMSDNANKMGSNMEDIQNAYQGFAKQNYTMLDNLKLGYGGTKSEMERLLKDATKLTGVKYDINNLADVYDAIHAVQEELDITGTTAKESAETFSGSLASMKAAFSNVLGNLSIGQDVTPALQALAETVSTFLFQNFLPMIMNILTALPGAIVTFITAAGPAFSEAGNTILSQMASGITTGLPGLMKTFHGITTGIMTWITENLPSLLETGVQILTNIANGILVSIPGLITIASDIIMNFVEFLMTNIPTILEAGKNLFLNLVDGIIQNLPAIGESAIQAVSKFIDVIVQNYPKYISTGWDILKSLVKGILDRLPDLIQAAIELIAKFATMLISKIPDILKAGAEIMVGLIESIVEMIPDILDAGIEIIGGFLSGIGEAVPDVLSAIGQMGSDLWDSITSIDLLGAGRAIIDGFVDGLKGAWESGKDFVGGIGDWIKEHKGPISYDRKLLIPAGKAIIGSLNESMADRFRDTMSLVLGMAGRIQDAMDTNFDVGMDDSSAPVATMISRQSALANGLSGGQGGTVINVENKGMMEGAIFNVRKDSDIDAIAEALLKRQELAMGRQGLRGAF